MLLESPQVNAVTLPVLLNGAAGGGPAPAEVAALFRAEGLAAHVLHARDGEELVGLARELLQARPPVLVVGGGDGTLNGVVNVLRAVSPRTALGVLPAGTLNHFARDLGIPPELAGAVRALASGRRAKVDLGEVNGRFFLNNSSIGLYADMVRARTRQQRRLGLSKRAAMVLATLAVLDRSRLMELSLQLAERVHRCRAPFVFVGNNDYQMEGLEIGRRNRLDAGRLSIYTTQRSSPGGLLLLMLRALLGGLRPAEDFTAFTASALRVGARKRRLFVATDGEVTLMDTPLEYRIHRQALEVLVP